MPLALAAVVGNRRPFLAAIIVLNTEAGDFSLPAKALTRSNQITRPARLKYLQESHRFSLRCRGTRKFALSIWH
jgi:hypothetical protein